MKTTNRKIKIHTNSPQWQLHQHFNGLLAALDRLPDAAAVQRNPLRSAPPERILMVF